MQYLKWAIILIVVYYLYTRFISKEKYTLVSDHPIEAVVTSKSLLKPGIFYRKGTLKSGIYNTINGPLNGGQTCNEFPLEIYIPVAPQNATCDLSDSAVYDTGVAVSAETRTNCPNNMKTINKKSTTLLNSLVASGGATRTVAINGGTDCATQAASLPATKTRACTNPIPAECDLTDSMIYDTGVAVSAETRTTCPNNMKTINKKSTTLLNSLTTSGGATRSVPFNLGSDCATQAASLPATKTRACTNPIPAECDLTKSAVYDTGVAVSAETRANCPNNMKTINKKSTTLLNSLVANGGSTRTVAINGGTDCATQAASLPTTDTTNCTNPIAAVCRDGDFTGIISNVNANYTVDTSVTQVGSYWSAL